MKKILLKGDRPLEHRYKMVDPDIQDHKDKYSTYKYMGFENLAPPDKDIVVKGDQDCLRELQKAVFWSTLIQEKVVFYIEHVLKYKTNKKRSKGNVKRRFNTLSIADIKTFLRDYNPRLYAFGDEDWITDTIIYTKNLYMLALDPKKDFDIPAVKRNANGLVFYGKTAGVEVDAFTGCITIPDMSGKGKLTFKTGGMTQQRESIGKIKIKKDPLDDERLVVHIRHNDELTEDVPYLQSPEKEEVTEPVIKPVCNKLENLFK